VGDDFSGPLHKCDQYVERSAAEWHRLVSLLDQPGGRKQAEWTERKHVLDV
jgi:hypothetical protein